MRDTLDMLYRYKTTEEDFDKFLDNVQICKYCADKLRGNKEVARSFFQPANCSTYTRLHLTAEPV